MTALAGWQNFYVIVGSSAGALIGLQFVVMSLITNMPRVSIDPAAGRTFATPTIMHFCAALLLAGILSAPWSGIGAPMLICGIMGAAGVVYAIAVMRRMRGQSAYRPEFEDWLFHCLLPLAAYATLAGSAYAVARFDPYRGLFGVAAAALVLLFIGIHNAWDTVTYHVFVKRKE